MKRIIYMRKRHSEWVVGREGEGEYRHIENGTHFVLVKTLETVEPIEMNLNSKAGTKEHSTYFYVNNHRAFDKIRFVRDHSTNKEVKSCPKSISVIRR